MKNLKSLIAPLLLALICTIGIGTMNSAYALTYQEGDEWLDSYGETMDPDEAAQWEYTQNDEGITLTKYTPMEGVYSNSTIGDIPFKINGVSIIALNETFSNCEDIIYAPNIPLTVKYMNKTFANCTNLTGSILIPNSVTYLDDAFEGVNNELTVYYYKTNINVANATLLNTSAVKTLLTMSGTAQLKHPDGTTEPLANTKVELKRRTFTATLYETVYTDENGHFTFTNVPPISGYHNGYENVGEVVIKYLGIDSTWTSLDVSMPQNLTLNIERNYNFTDKIYGTVMNDTLPLDNITIILRDGNGTTVDTQVTDSQGKYSFSNLSTTELYSVSAYLNYNSRTYKRSPIRENNEEFNFNFNWIGTDGKPLTSTELNGWKYNNNKLTYTGEIVDGKIVGKVPAIVDGNEITELNETFIDCSELTTAPEIPNSVIDMTKTFYGCSNLTDDVVIPDSVTNLTNTFTNTVQPIALVYTANNTAVESTSFPDNVTLKLVSELPTTPGSGGSGTGLSPVVDGTVAGNMSIYGTVEPIIMIDVTIPVTGLQFTINADRTITWEDIEITSNSPSPLVVAVISAGEAVLTADETGIYNIDGAPALVADDTFSDWNNLSKVETKANIAISVNGENISTASSDTPVEICLIESAYGEDAAGNYQANPKTADVVGSALYGKGWDNAGDLMFKYDTILEFSMP